MKFNLFVVTIALTLGVFFSSFSHASVVTYSDRALFEADTGATSAGNISQNADGVEFSVGILDFKNANGSTLNTIRNWSTLIDEEYDLGLSGPEHFDVQANEDLFAFGFDFHESSLTTPPNDSFPDTCNTPSCIDSLFEVSLLHNGIFVDSIQFQRPDDILTFVGVSSSTAFNEVRIREIQGNSDNEYFGNFTIATSVPAPASALILSLGLLMIAGSKRAVIQARDS